MAPSLQDSKIKLAEVLIQLYNWEKGKLIGQTGDRIPFQQKCVPTQLVRDKTITFGYLASSRFSRIRAVLTFPFNCSIWD